MVDRTSTERRLGQSRQVTVPPDVPGVSGGFAVQSRSHHG